MLDPFNGYTSYDRGRPSTLLPRETVRVREGGNEERPPTPRLAPFLVARTTDTLIYRVGERHQTCTVPLAYQSLRPTPTRHGTSFLFRFPRVGG